MIRSVSSPAWIARLLIAPVAVVLVAWFALTGVQSHSLSQASTLFQNTNDITPAVAQRIDSMLDTAGTLNPDSAVDLLRGETLAAEGRTAQARAVFQRIVRREPENVLAWAQLVGAGDFPAAVHVAQLEPKVPGS